MKFLKDTRNIIGLIILLGVIIKELGKSIRIEQFKNFNDSKIESIGKYEKDSNKNTLDTLKNHITDYKH
ncbi:hypothetical protein [Psychroserpens sp. S379A]|uniref:hypothetical protein n=1 Tax=Psychroserpens sp. S379A TaxID=3415137 RepID=UPI003C7E41D0